VNVTEIAGFLGVGLSGAAYVPQIVHLIRGRCSAGVSRPAYRVWLIASVLLAIKAIGIQAWIFIALGAIQVVATMLILLYAARYKDEYCPSHSHERDVATTPEKESSLRPSAMNGSTLMPARPATRDVAGHQAESLA
jgi:uncharacterized protein with PQ loop repeat